MIIDQNIPQDTRSVILNAIADAENTIVTHVEDISALRYGDKLYVPEIILTSYHLSDLDEVLEFIKAIGERKHATERVIAHIYRDPESPQHFMTFASA